MELTKIKYMNNPKNYKNWNINIEQERELWKKYMLWPFIIIPETCIHFKHGYKNAEKINNQLESKCNHYKCSRNINIRKNDEVRSMSRIKNAIWHFCGIIISMPHSKNAIHAIHAIRDTQCHVSTKKIKML